jgi:DNA-binding response OmpR family regulator
MSGGNTSPYFDHVGVSMRDIDDDVVIILVATQENIFNNIRDALAETTAALLHAQTNHDAIALVERLRNGVDLAIVELELPDFGAWDLLRKLSWRSHNPVKVIATTVLYPEPELDKELGVVAVVPKVIPPEEWRRTVETALGKSVGITA